ncbi:MAG: PqqD family peptide modification chaperone [Gemmatimonadaceae bacterium]
MISADSTVVATKEQVTADLAGEAVILNLKNSVYYGLDPVGVRIWSLLQEPKSVREVRDVLLEEYDVGAEECERSVVSLLEDLAKHGLVEVDGTDAR